MNKTLIALAAAGILAAPLAEARITRIEITGSQSPTFGGFSWPGVGQYEKIAGIAHGEVNPHDRQNRDHRRHRARAAQRARQRRVLVQLLHPEAHRSQEGRAQGDVRAAQPRRQDLDGPRPGQRRRQRSRLDHQPDVLANAFLMPRGYTLVWSGWENDLADLTSLTASAHFPIARNRDGSSITGPSYEYIVVGSPAASVDLTYPAATLDKSKAKLTHRIHLDDAPEVVPDSGWNYNADGTAISLAGASFAANDIYEFSYTAKDPTVNGLGFAAVRDWNAWLRYDKRDDNGNPNPLAGDIQHIYTEISSQPGRLLNDFRHLGFNEAENGKKVFDGHMQWIAAGNGLNMNYRFSQTGRTERNRQNHLYIEGRFPFANVRTFDPITRTTDSRNASCEKTHTCALGVEIYSANEYWVKAASLLHTTPDGRHDLPDSPFARNYFISSMQHGTGNGNARGACQQNQNPLNSTPVQRALFIALDEWASNGTKPPKSRVPTFKDGTLVPPLPQSGMGFPNIPSPFADTPGPFVTYTGLKTTRYHFDYGAGFYETGIATINPPVSVPRSRPRIRTIRRTGRSIRASSRRPTATATTSPACVWPT